MAGAWLVVVVLATTLTWQIVSAADDRVSDRPAPLNLAAPVITDLETTTTTMVDGSGSSSTTTPQENPTTTTDATTSSSGAQAGTTSSTVAATTSTTPSWQTELVQTAGGSVTLRYLPGEVVYQSATPAPGFHVEVGDAGPPEVEVEFESESSKIEIHAAWREGALDVDVSESEED
jgi:hypothetical protein